MKYLLNISTEHTMRKLYHQDRWGSADEHDFGSLDCRGKTAWCCVQAWTETISSISIIIWVCCYLCGNVETGRPRQVDFVMHSLWWQVFWIFALSTQCGSFTTKIVEGLQMNTILDRLIVVKNWLDAAFKLELRPYHPFPYLVRCVVAFVENGRPRQVDIVMHSLWWSICWIFLLSTPCGIFTTKIAEGLIHWTICESFAGQPV